MKIRQSRIQSMQKKIKEIQKIRKEVAQKHSGSLDGIKSGYDEMNKIVRDMGKDFESIFVDKYFSHQKRDCEKVNRLPKNKYEYKKIQNELLLNYDNALENLKSEFNRLYGRSGVISFKSLFENKIIRNGFKILSGTAILWGAFYYGSCFYYRNNGLMGEYFSDTELKEKSLTQLDKKIDFNYGVAGPVKYFKRDQFSIRWTGFLKVPRDGKYELFCIGDDGFSLLLGSQLIVEDWNVRAPLMKSQVVELQKGYYPIKLEYFDYGNLAQVKLFWRSGFKDNKKVITPRYFIPVKENLNPNLDIHDNAKLSTW